MTISNPHRRHLLAGGVALGLAPGWAQAATAGPGRELSGADLKLVIDHGMLRVGGRDGHAVTINGTVPGPLLRLKEGQKVRLAVENRLAEDTSIHWHGLLVPSKYDEVPGLSFPGIRPGETFVYEFPLIQSGTYWYHSHSGLQEPMGHYAPLIIDPAGPDPIVSDREHVIMLSDFSFTHPHVLMTRLKQQPGYFNFQKQTLAGLLRGRDQTLAERREWAKMLMDPTDISDITGSAFTYLLNGRAPGEPWSGLARTGERVRLRIINAAAQTIFNLRIPGLKLTVVAADGQAVRPIEVDELQIANAETYDLIVQPTEDRAYAVVAEAVDRSGMARAILAPRPGMAAEFPPLRERPLGTMRDMGMDMSAMTMGGPRKAAPPPPPPGMAPVKPRGSDVMGDMGGMEMSMRDPLNAPSVKLTPGVQSITPIVTDRTGEPGQGLESVGHRVLTYRDLVALAPNPDTRAPTRTLEIHLTGNMERFMWGFDGLSYAEDPPPYPFREGERVRVTLVNDTMMAHPIHLHGHFFELVHGPDGHKPRKHTVTVQPGGKVVFDLTAEAVGDWAMHCHMLYHMHAGMFRVVTVRPEAKA